MRTFILTCLLASAALSQAQWRNERVVRGTWLQPPASIAGLEVSLNNLSNAGITDLYLDTFYTGVSTGKQGVFNSRFGYDYLDQAIPLAARYGIRIHAWMETSYWQFGTGGAYNFTNNPEWRVINTATGTFGGDQASQVFANLCHPGVQQKMRNYCAEIAAYPGLWGIQTDYHRMPVDNSTSDSYPAPWSYDAYSNSAFQAIYGAGADINTTARRTNQSNWTRFLNWRRAGIVEAANQMKLGITGVASDVVFSGAVFGSAMTSSAQISKCQDWPTMAANGILDQIVPMAYSTSLSGVTSELTTTVNQAGGKPVIAGLAITGASAHPDLITQLNAIKAINIHDYIVWYGPQFDSASLQVAHSTWIAANDLPLRADLNDDKTLDGRDWNVFLSVFNGTPVPGTGRMDLNGNSTIDSGDGQLLRLAIAKFRFGAKGLVTSSDWIAFERARTGSTLTNSSKSLFNLDGDGDVDEADRGWMRLIASTSPLAFIDVSFQDSLRSLAQDYTFSFRDGSGQQVMSVVARADANGRVVIPTPDVPGNYTLSLKFGTFLRKNLAVDTTAAQISPSFSLKNGDVNGDNVVDLTDSSLVALAFNGLPGSPNWIPDADLNWDQVVDLTDYTIVALAFNEIGEE